MAGIAFTFAKFPVALALDILVLLYELRIAAGMFVRHAVSFAVGSAKLKRLASRG